MIVEDLEIESYLNSALGGNTYTPPATWYVGALNTGPNAAGGAYVEPSTGSYARVTKTNNDTNFPDCVANSRTKLNGTVFTFPTASASWGAIEGIGLFIVSPTGTGVCKFYAELPTPETINNGNTLSFAVGEVSFSAVV